MTFSTNPAWKACLNPDLGETVPSEPALPEDPSMEAGSPGLDPASYQVVQDAVLGLWDVVNRLTTLPPPPSDRYRVTIFGSARMERHTELYQGVCNLARNLTLLGCDIVTGGGPGLMQAANEGSVLGDPDDRTQSIGIRVHLDFEQAANPFVEQVYQHRTFFTRLHHFMWISDAFVVVPGGIGSCLEMFMVWQLLQVKELDKPLILIGKMWKDLVGWAEHYMLQTPYPMIKASDLRIPCCVETFEEASDRLQCLHEQWQRSQWQRSQSLQPPHPQPPHPQSPHL